MEARLDVMIMSGVEDGSLLKFNTESGDGQTQDENWTVTIGRREDNDICLRNDTYVSRQHAKLHLRDKGWWLEDCESTNGTFVETAENPFDDVRVTGTVQVKPGQLFRVGRTWLRIQTME